MQNTRFANERRGPITQHALARAGQCQKKVAEHDVQKLFLDLKFKEGI